MKTVILLLAIILAGDNLGQVIIVDSFRTDKGCLEVKEYITSTPYFNSDDILYVCAKVTDDQGG